ISEAILEDNADATLETFPAMLKIDAPQRLVVNAESVSELVGHDWDPQELHLSLISISGQVYEDDDKFELYWGESHE
ncbi:MAG: MmoB/DmpM family protein, partial [Gammaproteobacteria bacterium]